MSVVYGFIEFPQIERLTTDDSNRHYFNRLAFSEWPLIAKRPVGPSVAPMPLLLGSYGTLQFDPHIERRLMPLQAFHYGKPQILSNHR